jgi:SNF2 family DNA or RNA helicase
VYIDDDQSLRADYADEQEKRGVLFSIPFRRIILDEGHIIRNRKAKISIAACALMAERRWILTGTPIVNKIEDMFSMIKFLRYEPYDEYGAYNEQFRIPMRKGSKRGHVFFTVWNVLWIDVWVDADAVHEHPTHQTDAD